LSTAREVEAHAPHYRVIFTVFEMKRLGRDAAELTALADHLTEHGLMREMLAEPLPGIYDPTGPGKLLFGFFAAMAETERENIRASTLEGPETAARKGKYGGRLPVITDDMLHTVLRRKALGESVEQIQPDLTIPTGKRTGQPSVASIYRALAEHEKTQAYPEAVKTTHAAQCGCRESLIEHLGRRRCRLPCCSCNRQGSGTHSRPAPDPGRQADCSTPCSNQPHSPPH
jgi:hypothetical protein